MSLDLAIALIVLFDLALIAGLAFAMSRPHKLAPHHPVSHTAEQQLKHGEAEHWARLRSPREALLEKA